MKSLVGLIMGSKSDWSTLIHTADTLEKLGIPFEVRVVSAHRTPDLLFEYAANAETRGLEVIIAGAGGDDNLDADSDGVPDLCSCRYVSYWECRSGECRIACRQYFGKQTSHYPLSLANLSSYANCSGIKPARPQD